MTPKEIEQAANNFAFISEQQAFKTGVSFANTHTNQLLKEALERLKQKSDIIDYEDQITNVVQLKDVEKELNDIIEKL